MFWLSLLVFCFALVLIKLGSLSVWVSVLALGLKGALILVAGLVALFVGRRVMETRKS